MKTLEQGSNRFTTWLGNVTALDMDFITTWAYVKGPWVNHPGEMFIGELKSALFYNGHRFFRKVYYKKRLVGLFFMWRWSATGNRQFLQCGIGWKLNGRLALLFRVQSDASAAVGVSGPNLGQARGWEYGPH